VQNNKTTSVFIITLILASLSTIAPFSIDTYLPSFPSIAFELKASSVEMQQTMSLYMLGFAIMTLFAGSISDALGRRRVAMVALCVYALACLFSAYISSIDEFLTLRFIQGAAASVGVVIGRAVVRDMYSGDEAQKMMSNVLLFFAMAPALAPIIGGVLETSFGWRSVFVFLTVLALAVVLLVFLKLPETLPPEQRHSMHPVVLIKNYSHAITHVKFTVVALVIAFNFAGFFVYVTASPRIIFTHLGLSAEQFYLMFVPIVLGVMAGSFMSGRYSGKVASITLIKTGFLLMALASILNLIQAYWLVTGPFVVIAPVVLYAVGMALSLPALTVMGLDYLPHHRGLASSLQSFLHMGSNAIVAGVITPLVYNAIGHLAIMMTASLVLGLGLFLLVFPGFNVNSVEDQT